MFIKSLELSGFKRFALTQIDYFKITPVTKIQLILGSNGSGKSSLMSELSPLPANINNFFKDGFKYIEIDHKKSIYKLRSSFIDGDNEFSFIKDDEELNPGLTVTTYKELVKKEFNITNDVHEIMTGANNFHEMSTNERRTWFTKLSDNSYDFAISYYLKLKEQLRDIQGAIKLNQSRLVQESNKLIKPEEEKELRIEIDKLRELVTKLLEVKTIGFKDNVSLKKQITEYENKLIDLSKQVQYYRSQFLNIERFDSINTIELALIDYQSEVNSLQTLIADLCKQIEAEQKTVDSLQKANLDSFQDIDKNIDNLTFEISELSKKINLNIKFSDNQQAYSALITIYDNLVNLTSSIDENSDKRYSRTNYQQLLEQNKLLILDIAKLDNEQLKLINKRKELEYNKINGKIDCPKCMHTWYKGYVEKEYNDLIVTINYKAKSLEEMNIRLKQQEEAIERFKLYFDQYKLYNEITQSWSILMPLWTYLTNSEIIFNNPRQIATILNNLKLDLQIAIQIDNCNKKLEELIELKTKISKNQELDLNKLQIFIEELNTKLFNYNTKLQYSRNYISKLSLYRQVSIQVKNIQQEIENTINQRENTYEELLDTIKKEALNETIQVVQLELNKKEQSLSRIDIQKALVNNIENQLNELTEKVEVLKLIVKELSPNEGLIAKSLGGFINHFVFQINSFIKKIWLYPLELVPIVPDNSDSIDLDYKFAVKINNTIPIPDISKTSSAMKEVIDLAFRIVSMKFLGLQEAPIYLDEFAAKMDSAHRQSAFFVITNLLTTANFSQIFMISHYENSYGSLKNADITVLCPSNIVLPKDALFNTVTILR